MKPPNSPVRKVVAASAVILVLIVAISVAIYLSVPRVPSSVPENSAPESTSPTTQSPTVSADEYEPDNSFTQYSTISVTTSDQSQTRSIMPAGDEDCIRFYAEPSTYIFSTSGSIDTFGELYDSNQNYLMSNDDDGEGDNFMLTYEITSSGYHFLKVSAFSGDTGAYVLHFRHLPPPVTAELNEAIGKGLVTATVTGDSLQYINVALRSNSDNQLRIVIMPGTVFGAQSADVQNMVSLNKHEVSVEPHESVNTRVSVACFNMLLDTPTSSDTFTLGATALEELTRLLNLKDFQSATFRVKQFAIWTITDNPPRDEYVGIGSFGFGSGPSDSEIQEIRTLFGKAGISTQNYQALA